jgi:histidyl-tRNA synthetase
MYQAPRGTTDLLPAAQPYWSYLSSKVQTAAQSYAYRRIDTPIFESTGLFLRTVGEETDIVQKEMYSFEDRGEQQLTLRPEGTAPVCRAYLEGGLHNLPQPVRLYYLCPMFRYDRPQAGRYRQFHQFGVEAIGDADAAIDTEVIQLAVSVIESTGITGVSLVLNSIGDSEDRPAYLKALQDYYAPHLAQLCVNCRNRYQKNPLRLLDCKQASCQPFLVAAPHSADHLGPGSRAHWEELLGHLQMLGIAYTLDHRLVRGLDYYTRTVFELQPAEEGAQNTLCAGGRYDGLIQELGGPPTPGIGFAAGLERLILNMQRQGVELPPAQAGPVVVAYRGGQTKAVALRLAAELREQGISAVLAPERSLKAQMRYASSAGAPHTLILGEQEMAKGTVTIRNMESSEQAEAPLGEVASRLRRV